MGVIHPFIEAERAKMAGNSSAVNWSLEALQWDCPIVRTGHFSIIIIVLNISDELSGTDPLPFE